MEWKILRCERSQCCHSRNKAVMGELINGDRNSLWSGWAVAPDSAKPCSFSIVSKWGWGLPGLEWEMLLGEHILSWTGIDDHKSTGRGEKLKETCYNKEFKTFCSGQYVGCWHTKPAMLMSMVHGIFYINTELGLRFWRPTCEIYCMIFYLITWCETIKASL